MNLIYDYIDFSIKEYFKPCHELCIDLNVRIQNLNTRIDVLYKKVL